MDNVFGGRVAHQTKRQICSIFSSDQKELKIVALPVQQWSNAIDCGVFVLAVIHYIYQKRKHPVNFNTSKMRTHLLHCLAENELS